LCYKIWGAAEHVIEEIAQNFKEQGNDYFKGKRYREALGFYNQALDANPTDAALQEALLCNRAACNLELSELPLKGYQLA
jgi:tetratricopeptide (TPR) repeat protein